MNSTVDEFGDNPFRSSPSGGTGDVFFDATPSPTSPMAQSPQNFQSPMQQQPPPLQHQQPPPLQQQQFQPQPDVFAQPAPQTTFAPGPMNNNAAQPQQPPVQRSWWGNLMLCISMDSYRAYFDIDVDDIVARIKSVCFDFYKPEHFRNNVLGLQKTDALKGPDLYGPFWITMTLIFFIAVSLLFFKKV